MANLVAIMAVDPGKRTGLARAVFDLDAGEMLRKVVRGGRIDGWSESWEIDVGGGGVASGWHQVGMTIAEEWRDWMAEVRIGGNGLGGGVSEGGCHLVVEEFVHREGKLSGEDPLVSARIGAYVEGLLVRWAPGVEYQSPSMAKSLATDARLRDMGLWIRGMPHARDAWRHVVLRLSREL